MNDLISSLVGISRYRRLMSDTHLDWRAIHYVLDMDAEGRVINVSDTFSGPKDTDSKRFTAPKEYSLGSTNEAPANFFVAKGKHWFPVNDKFYESPVWAEFARACQETPKNHLLLALKKFYKRTPSKENIGDILKNDPCAFSTVGKIAGERYLAFRVLGRFLWQEPGLAKWWKGEYRRQRKERVKKWETGRDFFSVGKGKLAESFPTIMGNVPLASFDKAPFQSYGLGGRTTVMRLASAERTATVLNSFLRYPDNHFWLGMESVFIFWAEAEATLGTTAKPETDFVSLLNVDDALAIRDYFAGIWGFREPSFGGNFHAVLLSKNVNRAVVRSWLTDKLDAVEMSVQRFFKGIELHEHTTKSVTLRGLASCLLPLSEGKPQDPLPHHAALLLEHALFGRPLPAVILHAVLQRQIAEMAKESENIFDERLQQRTACAKLFFIQGGIDMNETVHLTTAHAAYYCGRLLAILSAIHDHAHEYKSASSPAGKYYASTSKTPALEFPRLLTLARYHLGKMSQGDREKMEFGIGHGDPEKELTGLAEIVAKFNGQAGSNFPTLLELEDQGRFAIGFYFERQRCQRWKYVLKQRNTKDNK